MSDQFTVEEHTHSTFEEKKSSFIAHLFPVEQFNVILENLKKEHPKARHFVSASRSLNEHDQIEESFSDDGEPRGTSGMPTLKVLQGNHLVNVGMITVRYFGGVKLGTGGLVRAYSDAANQVIEESARVVFKKQDEYVFKVDYTNLSKIEYHAEKQGVILAERDFEADGVKIVSRGDEESIENFRSAVKDWI